MAETTTNRLALTPAEAAAQLGISTEALHLLVRQGEIPAIRIGQRYRISLTALQAWLSGRCEPRDGSRKA